jgi:hypothetical protein
MDDEEYYVLWAMVIIGVVGVVGITISGALLFKAIFLLGL